MYDQSKSEIERTRQNLFKLEPLLKDSENFIYEYFEDIKRRVDLRREDLKVKIDTYSDEIIQSVESTKHNCIKSKENNPLTSDIEISKKI